MKSRKIKLITVCLAILCVLAACIIMWQLRKSSSDNTIQTVGGWENRPYNSEALTETNLPLTINIEKRNSGQFFSHSTYPDAINMVVVEGRVVSGSPVLRLQNNNEKYYLKLPAAGVVKFWAEPSSNIEILIYADAPSAYELQRIKVVSCAECKSDKQLKEFLLREITGLKEALAEKDTLKAAYLLLPWSARVSDLGSGYNKRADAPVNYIRFMTAAQIYYDLWENDLSGGSCGAFAVFYRAVLNLFDIDAFTVDMGLNADLNFTHVTTIVPVKDGDEWRFYLLDPTGAGTFMNNGKFMDLATLFTHYDKNKHILDADYWVYEKCLPRDYVVNDANGVARVNKNYLYCLENMIKGWMKRATEHNSPLASQLALYLTDLQTNMFIDMLGGQVFSVSRTKDSSIREQFFELLSEQGTELPNR